MKSDKKSFTASTKQFGLVASVLTFLLTHFSASAQVEKPVFDVQHYNFNISLNDENNSIKGIATITVKFLKDADSFPLDLVKRNKKGNGMLISIIAEEDKNISFVQDSDQVMLMSQVQKNSVHTYTIAYQGVPADGLIISTNEYGHRTFFGDNWPNRAHNWLPCADYPGDKATVDFEVTAPAHYQVIANGHKIDEKVLNGNLKYTRWKENAPLPTKVMVIGVAEFAIEQSGKVNNIPVYTYVFPEDKNSGFKSYEIANNILPYYIKNVGPFAYEKLANVQSKTIFGGMENASAIFYFEKSVSSKGIEELMAHEIAHQWFGDAASEKNFHHLWLSEGFATYMTNLYLESKYGPDTLKKREMADRQTVIKFEKKRLTPVVDTGVNENFMQLLNANSYQKGGWVLHMLMHKLGDKAFWKGIKAYYAKYNGGNANTDDLRLVMEQASGQDLKQFFNQWLYTAGHPQLALSWKYDEAKKAIALNIEQKQSEIYQLTLEVKTGGKLHTIDIKNRATNINLPVNVKPATLYADPDVNLLASFDVMEVK